MGHRDPFPCDDVRDLCQISSKMLEMISVSNQLLLDSIPNDKPKHSRRKFAKTARFGTRIAKAYQEVNDVRLSEYFMLNTWTKTKSHVLKEAKGFRADIWLQRLKVLFNAVMAGQTKLRTPCEITQAELHTDQWEGKLSSGCVFHMV